LRSRVREVQGVKEEQYEETFTQGMEGLTQMMVLRGILGMVLECREGIELELYGGGSLGVVEFVRQDQARKWGEEKTLGEKMHYEERMHDGERMHGEEWMHSERLYEMGICCDCGCDCGCDCDCDCGCDCDYNCDCDFGHVQ
jgi:hypothetical protein